MTKKQMIESMAYDMIRSPEGGWGETTQRWQNLVGAAGSESAARRAMGRMAAKYPDDVHPSRREQ
jgi:hypothetical protein